MATQFGKWLLFALLVVGLTGGCLMTRTDPSHQLEAQERIVSGSVDGGVSVAFLPRFQAGYVRGIGGHGDLNAHVGATPTGTLNLGVGSRLYLADWLTASLQFDVGNNIPMWIDDDQLPWAIITPRLMTSTNADRRFYGGIQANWLHHFEQQRHSPDSESSIEHIQYLFPGLAVGYAFRELRGVEGLQVELVVLPFFYDSTLHRVLASDSYRGSFPSSNVPTVALSQISLMRNWSNLDSQVEQLEPTEEPPADETDL